MKAESKEIIFGRYFSIEPHNVYGLFKDFSGHSKEKIKELYVEFKKQQTKKGIDAKYLPLKPLSSISDDDAKLLTYKNRFDVKNNHELIAFFSDEIDILRCLGYATAQTVIEDGNVVTYSVEELVSNGVFKF